MLFSIIAYIVIFFIMLVLIVQPLISESIYVKRKHKKLYNNLVDTISKQVLNLDLQYYEGQTMVLIRELELAITILQNQVYQEKEVKGKKSLYESINKLDYLYREYTDVMVKYKQLREKESVVYKYIADIEMRQFKFEDNDTKKVSNLLNDLVKKDIIKAFNYTEIFKKKGIDMIHSMEL